MYKILIICLLLLSGCVAKYQDISKHPGYAHLLNTSYTTKEEMFISGVNLPPGYGKVINVYIIGPINPTWIGPEVISRDILEKGTNFTIKSIKGCTNCLEGDIQAIVTIDQYKKTLNAPVEIKLDYIKPKYVNKIGTQQTAAR